MLKPPTDRKSLINFIESVIADRDYQFIRNTDYMLGSAMFPSYTRHKGVGNNMFGYEREAHFLLHHPEKWPAGLVIEARWQSKNGTTYQKFPFFVSNIVASKYTNIFVLGGKAAKPGSVDWLDNQVDNEKFLKLLTPEDFRAWAENGAI